VFITWGIEAVIAQLRWERTGQIKGPVASALSRAGLGEF
jgi:hypothetical protein